MYLAPIHEKLLDVISKEGFVKPYRFRLQQEQEAINELLSTGYLAVSKYNSYYCTSKASAYFRELVEHYSEPLTTYEMVRAIHQSGEYVVVDIETTGLSAARGDKIVEIAAIKVKDHEIDSMFHTYINPNKQIKNSHIHQITNDMVMASPLITEAIHDFSEFLGDAPIVSHNIQFDWYNFLGLEFLRNNLIPNNLAVCTLELARKYVKSPKHDLKTMATMFHLDLTNHHTAKADTVCAYQLLQVLLKMATDVDLAKPIGDKKF